MPIDAWAYREETWGTTDLAGFGVEAIDGSIGKIDSASNEVGSSHIVVDTGRWVFGKKVLLPAGVIDRVDLAQEKVFVQRVKDEIRHAPAYDESHSGAKDSRSSSF